jgi:Spy/CpxP family protein refolding chaperone
MFKQVSLWLVAVTALCVAAGSMAQDATAPDAGRRQRTRAARISTAEVPMPLLDSVVTLTAEQKDKLKPIYEKYAADVKALTPAGARKAGDPVDPTVRQKRTELQRTTSTQVEAILTPDQLKKLKQATPQITAARTAGLPLAVLADLKLTEEQRKQIAEIVKGITDQLKGMAADERKAKSKELQREGRTKVEALLSAEQKEVITKFQKSRRRGGAGAPKP